MLHIIQHPPPLTLAAPSAGDYEAVRDAQVRFERWAYNTALHFDPQGEHADKELAKVRVLLGPYHWALHFIFMRQNGEA